MVSPDRSFSTSFHTREADFRAVFVSAAEAINVAIEQVNVDPRLLYSFSELVVCTNLLASAFHGIENIALEVTSPSIFKRLIAEAGPEGIFRATCQTGDGLLELGGPNGIDTEIEQAHLRVSKRYPQVFEPVLSTVASESNSIPSLVQQFLHQSEQISTLMLTGMKLGKKAHSVVVDRAFGLLIEALPGVDENKKFVLTDNLERLESLTQYFGVADGAVAADEDTKDVMDLLDDIYPGEQWVQTSETPLFYRCRCHREGYLERLVELARKDMTALFGEQTELEIRCGYCANVFHYSRQEIEERLLKK